MPQQATRWSPEREHHSALTYIYLTPHPPRHADRDVLSLKNVQFVGEVPFLRYSSSDCAGAAWSVTISQLMLLSFVFLFGKFFYEENAKKQAQRKAANSGSEDAAASSGVEDSGTDGAKFDSDGSPLQSTSTTPKRGKGSGHDLRQRRSK